MWVYGLELACLCSMPKDVCSLVCIFVSGDLKFHKYMHNIYYNSVKSMMPTPTIKLLFSQEIKTYSGAHTLFMMCVFASLPTLSHFLFVMCQIKLKLCTKSHFNVQFQCTIK